jgi:hypothetical protein
MGESLMIGAADAPLFFQRTQWEKLDRSQVFCNIGSQTL